ncbi:MAG: adenylyl cyclase [Betaproteobacteria bacterium RIFCSPLOWO2_02_FULL_63_19]|nr:MAG: adenylyl cyclase [Betaproteobacteria bacterium RIFCSPLOWO2_02_FULL_63_19]
MTHPQTFVARLRTAGVEPGDSGELRIRKSIMVFAMGLMTAMPMFGLALYWLLGLQLSASLPLTYQLLSVATLIVYTATGRYRFFVYAQLCLFLYFPFAAQLSIGDFVSASGVVLWGILAPIVAVAVLGPRESIPWFAAHVTMLAICGFIDFQLAGNVASGPRVPLNVSVFFFTLNFIAISTISYFLLRYAAQQKEAYQSELEQAHRLLQIEQDKSERLLLNILPGPVAERLKNEDGAVADGFADVTVMFADIVNFTRLAEGMAPGQIFTMLNRVFSAFDALADKHGLEKIKTIGDAYMVAGGLNFVDNADYTAKIAEMALDMRDLLAHDRSSNAMRLEIRIGIGTGPIVAGVVGTKKFIYDLWGDTVNMASRITAEGLPGMIQTDATTYRRLQGRFDFGSPETIYLKSKGETVIYRLIGRAPEAREDLVSNA